MSNETKWTKGEWEIEHFPNGEIMIVGDVKAVSDDEEHAKTVIEAQRMSEADAHLIAAAPDLYQAGEAMARALERLDSGHPLIADWLAASRKARGEQ